MIWREAWFTCEFSDEGLLASGRSISVSALAPRIGASRLAGSSGLTSAAWNSGVAARLLGSTRELPTGSASIALIEVPATRPGIGGGPTHRGIAMKGRHPSAVRAVSSVVPWSRNGRRGAEGRVVKCGGCRGPSRARQQAQRHPMRGRQATRGERPTVRWWSVAPEPVQWGLARAVGCN